MHFSIFNSITNTISIIDELSLLKVSLLLATRTNFFANTSEYISMYYAAENYTPEQKQRLYPGIIKLLNKDFDTENIEISLKSYVSLKKSKHKNKKELIIYQMAIRSIKAMEDYIKACVEELLVVYNFNLLKEFLSEGKDSIFKYYNGVTNFAEPSNVRRLVEFFSTAVYNINMIPVLPDICSIKNVNFLDINKNISLSHNDSIIDVIEFPLYYLHSPLIFDAGQIKQIRSELNENISAFYKNYIEFNEGTCTKIFDDSSITPILDFYNNITGLLSDINNTLKENTFLKQVPKNNPEFLDYTVSINFTSINNLLKIYNLYNIFPDDVIKYIEEYLIKYTGLNCLTNFITIKRKI